MSDELHARCSCSLVLRCARDRRSTCYAGHSQLSRIRSQAHGRGSKGFSDGTYPACRYASRRSGSYERNRDFSTTDLLRCESFQVCEATSRPIWGSPSRTHVLVLVQEELSHQNEDEALV